RRPAGYLRHQLSNRRIDATNTAANAAKLDRQKADAVEADQPGIARSPQSRGFKTQARPPAVSAGRVYPERRRSDYLRRPALSVGLPVRSPVAQCARSRKPGAPPPHIAGSAGWRSRAL